MGLKVLIDGIYLLPEPNLIYLVDDDEMYMLAAPPDDPNKPSFERDGDFQPLNAPIRSLRRASDGEERLFPVVS